MPDSKPFTQAHARPKEDRMAPKRALLTASAFAVFLLFAASLSPTAAFAEGERTAANTIYGEVLGGGLLYSLNYDRLIIDQLAVRAGFSYISITASSTSGGETSSASVSSIQIPVGANYVGLYSGSHGLETGLGATLVYASGSGSSIGYSTSASGVGGFGTINVGYRLQPVDGGFNFRIGGQILFGKGFGEDGGWGVFPWGYMSFGYTF